MRITRRLEFDAGHRIPDHASQCRHLHGHRYALEVTLSGEIIKADGLAVNGMVMDFADVKRIANELVVNQWDHAFLVYRGDTLVTDFLAAVPGHKTVVLDVVPTAENIAKDIWRRLEPRIDSNGRRLHSIRLYETPDLYVDYSGEGIEGDTHPAD